jgi:hypothetical protein
MRDFDKVKLDEVVPSSNSKRDPVQFSKQWPGLLKIDLVLFGEAVGG